MPKAMVAMVWASADAIGGVIFASKSKAACERKSGYMAVGSSIGNAFVQIAGLGVALAAGRIAW